MNAGDGLQVGKLCFATWSGKLCPKQVYSILGFKPRVNKVQALGAINTREVAYARQDLWRSLGQPPAASRA